MGLFDRFRRTAEDPTARFWAWFASNKDRVALMFEDDRVGMKPYEELTTEIKKVHEALMPELTRDGDGTNVLVISADGRREAVQPVMDLAEAAPDIPGWRIERFRKPAPEGMRINYQGLDIDPVEVRIAYKVDMEERVIHLGVVLPGFKEDDKRFIGVAFLYLDHTIGEYNTIMHTGRIDLLAPGSVPPNAHLITLAELREMIEAKFY